MTIDPENGQISWIPTQEQLGSHQFTIQVDDGKDSSDTQVTIVLVKESNQAPEITNTPPSNAAIGLLYQYQVQAEDPDGDDLTYFLLDAIEGMEINPNTGVIMWFPSTDQLGDVTLTIKVEDGRGGQDTQTGMIHVVEESVIDLEPVSIDLSNTTTDPQTLRFQGTVDVTVRNNGVGYFESGYQVILFEDRDHNQQFRYYGCK